MVYYVTNTAYEALRSYIETTSEASQALSGARDHAAEYGLPVPDESTGQLLTTLTAASTGSTERPQAVAITPAANVVGLYVLAGMPDNGILTCIDPEAEHQRSAKTAFREAGYAPSRGRFLPSRPLEVMTRLAARSYSLIYAEIAPADAPTLVDEALELLEPGGLIILADILLDGTIANPARKDRDTAAARRLDESLRDREDIYLSRLPLGAGMVLISRNEDAPAS